MRSFYKSIPYFLLMLISGNALAEQYSVRSGQFTNIQVTDSWSESFHTIKYGFYESAGASLFGFTNTGAVGNLCNQNKSWLSQGQFHKVVTLEGYTGIQVATGIILVPMNINASGSGDYGDKNGNVQTANASETSNQNGLRSKTGTYSNPNVWCSTLQPIDSLYTQVIEATRTSTGSVNWGIYVSSNVAAGVYNIPNVFMGANYINAGTVNFTPSKLNGSSISVWRPLECTISIPGSTVNFGAFDSTGSGWKALNSQNFALQVNCTGGLANTTTPGTISFTGSPLFYGDRSENLELTTDGTYGVGIVNGRYGLNNQAPCSPDNTDDINAIKFDGTKKSLNLKAGSNDIPITWTVCRRGDVQRYGATSAKATININWD